MDVWDICAGDALIKANGGQATDKDGNEINYEGISKSNGFLVSANAHSILLKRIHK